MAIDLLSAETSTASRESARAGGGNPAAIVSPIGGAGQGIADPASASLAEGELGSSLSALVSDYVQLTKPRIVMMILVTTTATAMIGAGGFVSVSALFWLLVGTAAVAGSAGAANQIWERVIDQHMTRTANRPLPAGRLSIMPAAMFTAGVGVAGTLLLHFMFGPVPAAVGVVTWLLYVLVYTPMKTRTAWNTTVGAVAGALPVLIGYTAMGGSPADWTGWLLVAVLIAWQYPHFMSIAWMYRRQYAEAGFCMTTTIEPTGRSAGWQSIVGSLALIGFGVTLCCLPGNWISAVVASVAVLASTLPMLFASIGFAVQPGDAQARKLLRSSLLVLPAVLAVVTLRLFW